MGSFRHVLAVSALAAGIAMAPFAAHPWLGAAPALADDDDDGVGPPPPPPVPVINEGFDGAARLDRGDRHTIAECLEDVLLYPSWLRQSCDRKIAASARNATGN